MNWQKQFSEMTDEELAALISAKREAGFNAAWATTHNANRAREELSRRTPTRKG